MISNPPFYYRRYETDLPKCIEEEGPFQCVANRCQSIASAGLPLLSLYAPFRTPLSLGLGSLRNVNHIYELIQAIRNKNYLQAGISSVQLALSLLSLACTVAAFVNPYFNSSIAFIFLGLDDIISSLIDLMHAAKAKDKKRITEDLIQIVSSALQFSFLVFGQIELLVSLILLQICLNLVKAIEEFKKGNYIEGICYLAYAILSILQVIPQIKIVQWKWGKNPTLEGVLCRDERGFVYVKVKDEYVRELNALFGNSNLPPYFGKGKAGAHISVIHAGALSKDVKMGEVGKTVKFTISYYDALKPSGFKGVDQVHFLGVSSPELDALRKKYGFSPKVAGNHDWHITFGVNYTKK